MNANEHFPDTTNEAPPSLRPATLAVRGGGSVLRAGDPIATPIVQSVSFAQEAGARSEMLYTRHGNTPNATVVQARMAALEGSEAALVLASGMGATSCTMLALLRPGDHLLASAWLYGGTRVLFEQELPMLGIEVSFVDPMETRAWRRNLRPNTRVLFLESPVNPTTRVLDLKPLRTLSQEHGLALVLDATFASPVNLRAIEHGVDVVIHSSTKYLNGHHDAMGGVVCGSESVIEEVRRKMMTWGQAPDPFAVWLLERGLKTLDVRVTRQNTNAQRVAEWASSHAAFRSVLYPGLSSHPDHVMAKQLLAGFGGIVGLVVEGGAAAAERMISRLSLVTHAPSLGSVDSLVSEPRLTSHSNFTAAERDALGIPDGFVRLSVGIEDADDIIDDLRGATAA